MAWHILEKLQEQVAQHSTLVGKFWTTFFFVLRFLIVVSIADKVFDKEQKEFICNTLTPGCRNVCFNEFSPISMIRFWAIQVLAVAIPSVIFIVYTAHKSTKIEQSKKLKEKQEAKKAKLKQRNKELQEQARIESWRAATGMNPPEYSNVNHVNGRVASIEPVKSTEKALKEKLKKEEKKEDDDKELKVVATKLDDDTPPRLFLAYVAQVVFRLIVEIAFIVIQLHIYVYKFWVPELYKCSRWPCPNVVDCFVSRPKEKTVMIWVMFGTGVIMIALGVIELYHLGFEKIFDAFKRRGEDITKKYRVASSGMPHFGGGRNGVKYKGGYPQAVGIRVGYARSSISGDGGGIHGDEFI